MGMEPKARRSTYVSKPSTAQGHVVKNAHAARVRIDSSGRMTVIVASLFSLELVSNETRRAGERPHEKRIATRRELNRIRGALERLFVVQAIESINPDWLAALPEGGEQNGGVEE